MDYKNIANEILKCVGGTQNVSHLTHCITRLRFTLKDKTVVDREAIKNIPLVIATVEKGGQFQVVIGNEVTKVFDEIIPQLNIIDDKKTEDSTEEKEKTNLMDKITSFISGVFIPVLGILTAEGVLKGLLACLTAAHVLEATDQTYLVLNAISDVLYYFFPIFLGASAAKQLKMNPYIGMAIGGGLIYPTFVAASTDGSISSFLGLPMTISNYSSTVFPVIFAVIAAYWLEKLLNRIVPNIVKSFLTPLLLIVIIVPVSLWIIGPSINFISGILATVICSAYNFNPVVAGLLIGGPWIVLVMLGLHWAFIPIFIMNLTTNGAEPILGLFAANQFSMAAAALGMSLVLKNKEKKSTAFTNGITCLLGVSEPAIYGTLLPYKKPFIIAIVFGSIGGAIAGFFGMTGYSFGAAGIFVFPCYVNPTAGIGMDFIGGVVGAILSAIVAFIVTYFVMKKDSKIIQENNLEN